MDERSKLAFEKCREVLLRDLDPPHVIPFLISSEEGRKILSEVDEETIEALRTRMSKADHLLRLYAKKADSILPLIQAIKSDNEFLSNELQKSYDSVTEHQIQSCRAQLKKSLPALPCGFVERHQQISALKDAIRFLGNYFSVFY